MPNFRKVYAIQENNKKRILKVNPKVTDTAGIYFIYRLQPRIYIGQAGGIRTDENGNRVRVKQGILTRLAQHLSNYQYIDVSIKKHGFYSEENPYGYKIGFLNFNPEELDEKEQYYIKEYADKGWELLNLTSGSQGKGKTKIGDYKPAKTYKDGLAQGKKALARDLKHIIDTHLEIQLKKDTKISQRALEKFNDLLNEENYK